MKHYMIKVSSLIFTAVISTSSPAFDSTTMTEPTAAKAPCRASLDHYEASISIENNSPFTLLFIGCNPDKGIYSRCNTSIPGVVKPSATIPAGIAQSFKHAPSGSLTFIAKHMDNTPFQLHYHFNKGASPIQLDISPFPGTPPSPLIFTIDTGSCTSNPDAEGIMRCCTMNKSKHMLHKTYEFQCTLPVAAGLASS